VPQGIGVVGGAFNSSRPLHASSQLQDVPKGKNNNREKENIKKIVTAK
jgi:hypothetical protein